MTAPEWTPAEDRLLACAVRNFETSWIMLSIDHFPRRTPGEVASRHALLVREGRA